MVEPYDRIASQVVASDREKVELFLSCRGLADKDIISKSDPQIIVYMASNNGQFIQYGKTELIHDNLNPDFKKTFVMDFIFEKTQKLKFEVIDVDVAGTFDHLGECVTSLGALVGARAGTSILELTDKQNNKKAGKLVVRVEKFATSQDYLVMKWKGYNLEDVAGWFHKSSPFLRFSRMREDGTFLPVHETEWIEENLNPRWNQFEMKAARLTAGNMDKPFKIECFHHRKSHEHTLMGEVQLTLGALTQQGSREFGLIGPNKKNAGKLVLETFTMEKRPEFLDYIRGGTQINVILAVDFTGSNGDPRTPSSLHSIRPGYPNQYQIAINEVCGILLNYDYDKKIPMFGFGAQPRFPTLNTNETLHCFSMTGDPSNAEVYGLEGIMNTYQFALQHVNLNGPTYFAPILREATNLASMFKQSGQDVYTVLLILTDGEIHDMPASIDALVGAAQYPLSVIIVGVGDADFTNMEILDGDNGLIDGAGRKVSRDLCQFVPFNKFKGNHQMLSEEVLAELPPQVVQYKKMMGQAPAPPKTTDLSQMQFSNVNIGPPANVPPGPGPAPVPQPAPQFVPQPSNQFAPQPSNQFPPQPSQGNIPGNQPFPGYQP